MGGPARYDDSFVLPLIWYDSIPKQNGSRFSRLSNKRRNLFWAKNGADERKWKRVKVSRVILKARFRPRLESWREFVSWLRSAARVFRARHTFLFRFVFSRVAMSLVDDFQAEAEPAEFEVLGKNSWMVRFISWVKEMCLNGALLKPLLIRFVLVNGTKTSIVNARG